MDFLNAASFVALSLAIYVLLPYITSRPPLRLPPGPRGWPIIGNLLYFTGPDLPHHVLSKLADQHGPIMHVRLGSKTIVVVSSPEAVRECLTAQDEIFASRPANSAGRIIGFGFNLITFAPYGPYLREARKLISHQLLSSRNLLALADIRDEAIRGLIAGMIRESLSVPGAVEVRIRGHLADMVMGVVLRMMGKRHYDFATEQERRELTELIDAAFYQGGKAVVGDVIPGLKWVDVGGKKRAMEEVAGKIRAMTVKWVEERRKKGKAEEDDMDFLDLVIETVDGKKMSSVSASGAPDNDLVIVGIIQSVIFGAFGTTTVTLEWAFSELLNNQTTLQTLQQEIDSKIGSKRKVEETDIKDLSYLQAVVKETLRLHPPGPLLVPHKSTEDCTVMGYHVPADTRLIIQAWKIQRDPRYWTKPLEFVPERFLGPEGMASEVDLLGRHFTLIPFGAGRRACPGTALALHILHLTIARLIHAFEWKLPAGDSAVDMSEGLGLVSPKAMPLVVELGQKDFLELYY